jgi:hypothetical protein
MNTLLIFVAVAMFGHEVGWERLPSGEMEYIIQLDPAALDALQRGQPIRSDILSAAGEVRSYRIVVGTGKLKREMPAPKAAPPQPVTPKPATQLPSPQPVATEPPMSWTLTALGLFGSVGVNLFLAWTVWGLRRRCLRAGEKTA